MELSISIEKLGKGDEEELKRLYQFVFPHFVSFAQTYLPDSLELCKDFVQDLFLIYWECREQFTDAVSLKVFFYRSIRNRCLNELRSRLSHQQVACEELERLSSSEQLEEQVIREEVAMLVRREVAQLTKQEQRVLRLSMQGKSNQEIADTLSLSVNTVKTHKQKAYAQLRIQLKEIYTLLTFLTLS